MTAPSIAAALALLEAEGIQCPPNTTTLLEEYSALVRAFNPVCGLVSRGDADRLEERHIVDSLSLAPVLWRRGITAGRLLDIGSGGGFPAVPLKVVLPGLTVTMVERSTKRAGFLRKVVGALGLEGIEVVMGSFPGDIGERNWDILTARAVDKPQAVMRDVLGMLPSGCVFLCQFGAPELPDRALFHVERIDDDWGAQGLRRGSLHTIQRRPA